MNILCPFLWLLIHQFLPEDSLMKNEGSYEISIPFEDNNGDQTNYFNQSQQPFEGSVVFLMFSIYCLWSCGLLHWSNLCHRSPIHWTTGPMWLLPTDLKPPHAASNLFGEELMAAEAHRGPGGGKGLPTMPVGALHQLHQEPGIKRCTLVHFHMNPKSLNRSALDILTPM